MISEKEFYEKIIEDFQVNQEKDNDQELWKYRSINKMMKFTTENDLKRFTDCGLVLIMGLHEKEFSDLYELNSNSVKDSSPKERDVINSILMEEFLS